MIYINEGTSTNNRNGRIGWVVTEAAPDPSILQKPKISMRNGKPVAESIYQRGNIKNRNGRWYDTPDLASQIVCPRSIEMLRTGWGSENGHPLSSELVRQQTIDPNNVVAYILDLWMDGDLVMGKAVGSNLEIGKAFSADLLDGFTPAWSLRALGSIENTNRGAEVKGLKIITYDRVYYPSHPEAYTRNIVTESATYENDYIELSEGVKIRTKSLDSEEVKVTESGIIAPVTNQNVIDYIQQESCNYKQVVNEFEIFYDDIQLVNEGTCIQLSNSSTGNVFIVKLESYIHNEIMDYCDNK
ncbi:hypothetical protein [uncultured Clostridium sp.]|uniref:hypothetical protein n=1 Tax=uncultured Clostridium sp. TaxID=59620 RepID=UPI00263B5E66|nr:hypothetical protein [uncultured Clostridium sp.]